MGLGAQVVAIAVIDLECDALDGCGVEIDERTLQCDFATDTDEFDVELSFELPVFRANTEGRVAFGELKILVRFEDAFDKLLPWLFGHGEGLCSITCLSGRDIHRGDDMGKEDLSCVGDSFAVWCGCGAIVCFLCALENEELTCCVSCDNFGESIAIEVGDHWWHHAGAIRQDEGRRSIGDIDHVELTCEGVVVLACLDQEVGFVVTIEVGDTYTSFQSLCVGDGASLFHLSGVIV